MEGRWRGRGLRLLLQYGSTSVEANSSLEVKQRTKWRPHSHASNSTPRGIFSFSSASLELPVE
jgi:hypothetical protein